MDVDFMLNFFLANIFIPIFEKCSRTEFWSLYRKMFKGFSNTANSQHSEELKLKNILKNASDNTEFWSRQISKKEHQTAFQLLNTIPISQKNTYAQGFPDQITVKNNTGDWQYLSSAGTTGRMTVVVDFEKRDYLRAAEHLNLKLATGSALGYKSVDIPPSACNVVCGFADQGPEPLFKFFYWALKNNRLFTGTTLSDLRGRFERQIMLKREVLMPINSVPWEKMCEQLDMYLDDIIENKVCIIRALPHFLLWLAKRAEQRQLQFPHVKTLLPYGGLAGKELVKTITHIFQAKYINVYGTGEVGSIGCAISDPHIVDIYSEMVCLEVLDGAGGYVPLNIPGRVVVTDLNNFAMPIIRYEIGDIAEVIEYDEHNGLPKKIKILGRKQECLDLPSGECITPLEIQDVFFKYPNIINFKLEQITSKIFKVSIVCLGDVDIKKLSGNIQSLLELSKPPSIKMNEFIIPEQSGKFLSVKTIKKGI
jgi:phenylacetate-CoA ligase